VLNRNTLWERYRSSSRRHRDFDRFGRSCRQGWGVTRDRDFPRVLVLSSLYPRPGDSMFGVFVHRQVRALRKAGIDATVLSPVPRGIFVTARKHDGLPRDNFWPAMHTTIDGVEVHYVPFWHVPHALSIGLEIRSLTHSLISEVRRLGAEGPAYDLIHAYWAVPMGAAALEVAESLGIPVVLSVRGSDIHTYPNRRRSVRERTRQVLVQCDRVTAVSARLTKDIRQLVGSPSTLEPDVVYNGVDTSQFFPTSRHELERQRLGLPSDGVGFCCVARLVREKGIWELVEAFHEVKARIPETWLALVGDGPLLPQLEEWIVTRGLQSSVFLAGLQEPDQVVNWLNAADVFVLPSHNEGLPNSVLEAMACRLPVVATAVGGIPEAVEDGGAALLVDVGDTGGLAAALQRVALDRELRESMGATGLAVAETKFSWDASAESLLEVYGAAVNGHTERAGNLP